MYGSISDEALREVFNFTRCMRPNKTHYGSKGKCRKGVEVDPTANKKDLQAAFDSGEILGKGEMGEVRRNLGPPVSIVKKGTIGEHEAEALNLLKGSGIAPELISQTPLEDIKQLDRVVWGGHISAGKGMLQTTEAKGSPVESQTFSEGQKEEQIKSLLVTRAKLHSEGVAHNDLHYGNVFYDKETKKTMFVDFGLSQVGGRFALVEALLTPRDVNFPDDSPLLEKFLENRKRVSLMLNFGPYDSVAIRSRESDLPPSIRDLSEAQSQKLIKELYRGLL